jgi:hypothetical protein
MISIALTPEDAEILEGVLDSYLSDLRQEITHTERKDFRDRLKAREACLHRLIARLESERARAY